MERYLQQGGRVLILGASNDEVIPEGVTRRYIKEVTYHYVNTAVRTEGVEPFEVGYLYIPEGHTKTTTVEVDRIAFFSSH